MATAEKTGGLVASFDYIANYQERNQRRTQEVLTSLIYPSVLFLLTILVALLFVYILGGQSGVLFTNLGDELPLPTYLVMTAASVLGNTKLMGLFVGGNALAIFGLRRLILENRSLLRSLHGLAFDIPVVGPVLLKMETARMVDVMSSTLRAGLPLVESIRCASRVCRNFSFRDGLTGVERSIIEGRTLTSSIKTHIKTPPHILALVEVGETTGDLGAVMQGASKLLDDDVEDACSRMVLLLEPLMLALGGCAAAFVAVATFLPIIRLMGSLS